MEKGIRVVKRFINDWPDHDYDFTLPPRVAPRYDNTPAIIVAAVAALAAVAVLVWLAL